MKPENLPVDGGKPLVICEMYNPGADASNRDFFAITPADAEVLLPEATISSSGTFTVVPSGTIHDALADNPADDTTSVQFPATGNFVVRLTDATTTPIESINIIIRVKGNWAEGFLTVTLKTSGGTTIALFDVPSDQGTSVFLSASQRFTENSSSLLPFTVADLTDATLTVAVDDGVGVEASQLIVEVSPATIIACQGGALPDGIVDRARLMVSTKNFIRLDNESDASGYTDVRGSVVNPTLLDMDWGVLYGQAYFSNGCDDVYVYPNSSNNFFQLAGKPKGRTVAGFADRILLGWTSDAGEETPERIIYSNQFDGQNFDGPSAGDFDVLSTPSGVVKLLPLAEDTCACYKQIGVYILRRTGDATFPLVPDLIDPETGCLAQRSVQASLDPAGNGVHYFLGRNSLVGINVFRFDGSQVAAVGDGISALLRDRVNLKTVSLSFGAIDPEGNNYWLFVPLDNDILPKSAFILNLRNGQWTGPHSFTPTYTAAGRWSLTTEEASLNGTDTLILGRTDGFSYKADYDQATDTLQRSFFAGDETHDEYAIVVETGDLRYAAPQDQAMLYRAYFHYVDNGEFSVVADVSTDGGITFNTALTTPLGTSGGAGEYKREEIDVTVANAPRSRLRFTFTAKDANTIRDTIQLAEVIVVAEPAGEAP